MNEYWMKLEEIDRKSLLESIYISPELASYAFFNLPYHIRTILYSFWNSKWSHQKNEIEF